jgi:DNA-binding MarR family transcriptional regulator
MTSNVIRTLEKKAFILCQTHQSDTKSKAISLSKSGLLMLTEVLKIKKIGIS